MNTYIFGFEKIDKTSLTKVGGKGANLGELSKIEGITVPDGFCVSTAAFKEIMVDNEALNLLLDELLTLEIKNRKNISEISSQIRKLIEETTIPKHIENEISRYLQRMGEGNSYAVRSSATAEDLPTASFAGQQDTYLNVIGKKEILKHINKCWASLYTDRAVIYRLQNGFDQGKVWLSVVIQKMIFPDVAGIMFTADPVNSNRKVLSIDASFGLGEALVSGIVNADNFKVRAGHIIGRQISEKKLAVRALEEGGTRQLEIRADQQNSQSLTDQEVLELELLGRKIEAHFDHPQDIEWCLAGNAFYIVQSRPITTIFPVPDLKDAENYPHAYVSVGHQQMMTDAMKPLGLSFFLLTTPAQMRSAGGRLFVDVTENLASPESRENVLNALGKSDPLIKDALMHFVQQQDFFNSSANDIRSNGNTITSAKIPDKPIENVPAASDVSELIRQSETSIEGLKRDIRTKSGTALFDFILEDIQQLRRILFDPQSHRVIMAAMDASSWVNENMNLWLGEKNAADTLSQSVPNNVTSEMGLALLTVADVIRPYTEAIEFLQNVTTDYFPDETTQLEGGREAIEAIGTFLNRYGMRCSGEIDITRTRWNEKPTTLIPIILGNIKNFEQNAAARKFDQGRLEASKKEQDLLDRLRQLPNGKQKAEDTKQRINTIRSLAGYREYPKYGMVSRYYIYKQALLKEAENLIRAHIIDQKEDIYYLTFEELHKVMRTGQIDSQLISKRKDDFEIYKKLTPPRVMTSDGEIITGAYKRENLTNGIPKGAIIGLPVSSGVVEGRARVILNMDTAVLEDGDILVTTFTDPSWTPLFVSIKGLVTEVGGLMTHGAVIAREYGLPAVVGVAHATKLIKDGQQIRVNGTEGYVEILQNK